MFDGFVDRRLEGHQTKSDMILKPDLTETWIDPFSASPIDDHSIATSSSLRPGDWYSRDPRTTAKRAEAYLKSTGIGDSPSMSAPEAEFFMFDDVRFEDG